MSTAKRATLTRLKAMLDSGVRETSVDGVTTKFSSTAELRRRVYELEVELGLRTRRRRAFGFNMGGR